MTFAARADSVPATRLEALRSRHAAIEAELYDKARSPSISDFHLKDLKKMKLHIKQELAQLSEAS